MTCFCKESEHFHAPVHSLVSSSSAFESNLWSSEVTNDNAVPLLSPRAVLQHKNNLQSARESISFYTNDNEHIIDTAPNISGFITMHDMWKARGRTRFEGQTQKVKQLKTCINICIFAATDTPQQ